jgi:hypothetical protein
MCGILAEVVLEINANPKMIPRPNMEQIQAEENRCYSKNQQEPGVNRESLSQRARSQEGENGRRPISLILCVYGNAVFSQMLFSFPSATVMDSTTT